VPVLVQLCRDDHAWSRRRVPIVPSPGRAVTSAPDPLRECRGDQDAEKGAASPATVYLSVKLPRHTKPSGLAEIQLALADAARRVTATGHPVRYLNGMYMPARTRLLCVFTAESAEAVHEAAKLLRLPFTEIRTIPDRWERCPAATGSERDEREPDR
jgi:hypothetical protein